MKALIVEDNLLLAQSLQEMLSRNGWSAYTSCSWSEASSLLDKNSFELLVLDILLPDKKGFDILNTLSEKKVSPFLKIILISAFVDEAFALKNIPKGLKADCVFFKKPIEEKTFLNFLEKVKSPDFNKEKGSLLGSFFEKDCPSKPLEFYLPPRKTFDSKELIQAVFLAHLKKFTGEFKVKTDSGHKNLIRFYKGHIIKFVSNSDTSYFGALLVEHGLSLQEDIETFLEDKKTNKLIGEKLMEEGLLSPYMLSFMLKEQIKIRLSEIMSQLSFTLKIRDRPLENHETLDLDFSETDFIEWLADSLQTELTAEFLRNFYEEIKFCSIEKSSQVNKAVIVQKQFLQDYNLFFLKLKEGSVVQDIIKPSKKKNLELRLLYFGLLTKSTSLKSPKKESMNRQKVEMFLDSILEKDSQDMFSLLNLPWNASVKEVEKNYKQLIQNIHPDLLPEDTSKKLREKSEKAFYKIKKSYETLKDEKKRKEYIKTQKEENFVTVMDKYEEGLTKIKQGNYKTGLQILLEIVNHTQAPGNTSLYILWARLKSCNEGLVKNRSEAVKFQKAINSSPISQRTSPLFWYVKGLFYTQTEQYEKALGFFEKSLKVEKDFSEAKREVIFIRQIMRTLKPANKKSIFSSLFKKSG